jgi:cell division transport system permease protein
MRILRKFLYFLSTAIKSVKKNISLNILTTVSVSISLMILGIFLLFLYNLNIVLEKLSSDVEVILYLNNNIDERRIEDIINYVKNLKETKEVIYISKDEALQLLKKNLKGYKGILAGLSTNPLPPSIEIKLKRNFRNYEGIKNFVSNMKHYKEINDIEYGQEWIKRFTIFINFIKLIGSFIGGLLILAITFIIYNTIKLKLFARREEIEIMELIGATKLFIKAPLIIEGIFHGFLGAVLSIGILYISFEFIISNIVPNFPLDMLKIYFLPPNMMLFIIASGVLIGFLGSILSLWRFFKI